MTNSVLPNQSYSGSPLDVKGNLDTEQYDCLALPHHVHTHTQHARTLHVSVRMRIGFSEARRSHRQTWPSRGGFFYLPLERVLPLTGLGGRGSSFRPRTCSWAVSTHLCSLSKGICPPPQSFAGCKVGMGCLKQPQPSCRGEGTSLRTLRLSESKSGKSLVPEEPLS